MDKFDNTIFDEDFHTYLNGNLIYNIYCNKKNKEECDYITKNIIIDYHFNTNKIEKNDNNYKLYSDYYDKKLKHYNNNNYKKYIPYKYTDEYFEQLKIEKEENDYENDRKIHYNQYFGRYKDLVYIIQYYENLFEEYNNKLFEEEEEEYNIEEDNYYSDYECYDYESCYYNEDYDEEDEFD